jgi:hypothetical protein
VIRVRIDKFIAQVETYIDNYEETPTRECLSGSQLDITRICCNSLDQAYCLQELTDSDDILNVYALRAIQADIQSQIQKDGFLQADKQLVMKLERVFVEAVREHIDF